MPKGRTQRLLIVMIWGAITILGVGILLPIEGNINFYEVLPNLPIWSSSCIGLVLS